MRTLAAVLFWPRFEAWSNEHEQVQPGSRLRRFSACVEDDFRPPREGEGRPALVCCKPALDTERTCQTA